MNYYFPLGLDISDLKLRLVQIQPGWRRISLASFGEIDIPQGYIVDGVIINKQEVAGLLKKLKEQAKGRKIFQKKVIACLPEKQSFIKAVETTEATPESIKQEAARDFPFNWEEVYLDWHLISRKANDRYSFLIGACRKQVVESYLETLRLANLRAEVLEIECEAVARALLNKKDEAPILIIDLGYARTTASIYREETVQFTTSFSSVIKEQTIDLQQLEVDIQKIIRFYQDHLQREALKKIVLCGSGAYSPETVQLLNREMGIPVQTGNPFINFGNGATLKMNKMMPNSLAYTTAIGLALRAALNKIYI